LGTGEGGETDWQLGIHSTTATYDALGRMVEIGSGGTYTQFSYRPDGVLLALYSGGPVKTTIPLPGGSTAIYNSTGLDYIRHTDWLGSSRLATTWNHTVYSKEAYAPFGETYNEAGTPDRSFTGQDQDVVTGSGGTGVYDFLFRKYDPSAGRWLSPDPYGWGAVDLTTPQSLNRYAYVANGPLAFTDPLGLDFYLITDNCVYYVAGSNGIDSSTGNLVDNIGQTLIGCSSDSTPAPSGGVAGVGLGGGVVTGGGRVGGSGKVPNNGCTSCHITNYKKPLSCDVDPCTPAQKAQWCAGGKGTTAAISKATGGQVTLWATFIGLTPLGAQAKPVLVPFSMVKALNGYTGAYFDSYCSQ